MKRVLVALTLILAAGCADEAGWEHRVNRVTEPSLAQVDSLDLASQSIQNPVTVEQATSQPTTAPTTMPAAKTIELSLTDVRMAALASNLDLSVELVNPSIAQTALDVERAKFESTIQALAAYDDLGEDSDLSRQQRYSAGVVVPLRTGGEVTVGVPVTRSEGFDESYESGLGFSISHPLLRNAGVKVNEYSIRFAEYQKHIIDSRTKLSAIRILANADSAYWRLYASRGQLEVNRKVYDLARVQLDQAQKRVAAQASPRIEITRAESGVAAQLEAIIISETLVRQRERDLRRIMNRPDLPLDSPLAIVPTTTPNPLGLNLSPEQLASHAIANRMEMLELELQLAQDAITIDFNRNQTLPLFTVDYRYNFSRLHDRLGETFDLSGGDNDDDWSLQLRADIPIGNKSAQARLHRSILERIQRLSTRELRALAIRQEVFNAIDQLNQDWQRILAARNESILAGRTYEAEQRQFELGVRTSTDVLEASQRLANAQLREVFALTDYEISSIDIAFATGTLLGRDAVQLPYANVTQAVSRGNELAP